MQMNLIQNIPNSTEMVSKDSRVQGRREVQLLSVLKPDQSVAEQEHGRRLGGGAREREGVVHGTAPVGQHEPLQREQLGVVPGADNKPPAVLLRLQQTGVRRVL